MELDKIEKLLEHYFEGNSSTADEKTLKDYFASSNVAQHLQQYQPLFDYFEESKQQKFTQEIPLTPKLRDKKRNSVMWLSIAASVVVLFGAGLYFYNEATATQEQGFGTYKNPEIAFQETQKALQLLSTNVNVGIESVKYVNEYQQSKNLIFK
jgi:hypothetical protein